MVHVGEYRRRYDIQFAVCIGRLLYICAATSWLHTYGHADVLAGSLARAACWRMHTMHVLIMIGVLCLELLVLSIHRIGIPCGLCFSMRLLSKIKNDSCSWFWGGLGDGLRGGLSWESEYLHLHLSHIHV